MKNTLNKQIPPWKRLRKKYPHAIKLVIKYESENFGRYIIMRNIDFIKFFHEHKIYFTIDPKVEFEESLKIFIDKGLQQLEKTINNESGNISRMD